MNTLSDEWAEFRRAVVPADASDAQVKDMRTAFYAGALTMSNAYSVLFSGTPSDGDIETLEGWGAELEAVLGAADGNELFNRPSGQTKGEGA